MKKAIVVLSMVLLAASAAAPAERSQKARTFTGKIIERGGKFVLEDAAGKKTWGLDRQDKARPFAGQKVSVSGNYSSAGRMIQVRNIQATAGGPNDHRSRSIPPEVAHPDPTGPITPPTFPVKPPTTTKPI